MRNGDTFTSGVEHAHDHVAGGGAIVNPTGPEQFDGSGIPGNVSLLDIGERVTALEDAPPPSCLMTEEQLALVHREGALRDAITVDDEGRVHIHASMIIHGGLVIDGDLTVEGVITARDFVRAE